MKDIELLLVNPSNRSQMYTQLGNILSGIEPPLWTALIAALAREKGFSVNIIDADAQGWTPEYTAEKIIELNPQLVGIAVIGANPSASSTPKMDAASKVLRSLSRKAADLKTFVYGIHPSAIPERTLKDEPVDFIARGECFYTVIELLKSLKANYSVKDFKISGLWYKKDSMVIDGGWGRLVENLDALPLAAWDLLPMERYRAHNWHCFDRLHERTPYAVIYTSAGCPFSCSFCNISALYNGKPGIRFRSPERVVEEIDFLVEKYKVNNFKIIDEMFALDEARIIKICDLIIRRKYNLNIWAYSRIDTVNQRLLEKMKEAGINWLAFGIEAGSKNVRNGVNKGRFDRGKIKEVTDLAHKAGIHVLGNFIFGLPGEDLVGMQETLALAKELNCEYANFYAAMAYPGSKLYEEAIRKGVCLSDNWLSYSQFSEETLPLANEYLSAEKILRFRDKAFDEYYHQPKYLRMIEEKFGPQAKEHILKMLDYKINRKILAHYK